jgi:hypothetical protein
LSFTLDKDSLDVCCPPCKNHPVMSPLLAWQSKEGTLTDPGALQLVGKFMGYSGLYYRKIVFTELHCMDAVAVDLNSSDD